MLKYLKLLLISCIFFPNSGYSLTSSSYLITNAAISSFDYETASKYYNKDELDFFNYHELRKKLISLINSNVLLDTKIIAEQLVNLDESNEDAWLVLLSIAKLQKNVAFLEKFKIVKKKHNFEIIDYIFYSENQIINNNEIIAENFFNLLQMTNTSQIINNKSIDYYLFYLNLSLNFKPNYIEALFIKGQIYKELKFFLKAEKIFKKIEPHQSLYLEAQKNIILIKKEIYEFTKAEQILFNLIDKYPQDNSLLILLADMYRLEKKYEKSIQYYTLIINKKINNDNEWRLYFLRAICNERLNKWKKAERDLLKALEINPDQPQVLNYLAYGWIEKNYYIDKSINMLEIAVQKNPKSHYILDSLGWAYYKNNDLSKALQIMEKVIEMAPGEAISLDHLGDIYFSLGREKEAYFMWKQALDLAEPEDDISESVKNKIDKYNAG